MMLTLLAMAFVFIVWGRAAGLSGPFGLVAVLLVVVGVMFQRLRTVVEDGVLSWSMSLGWPRNAMAIADVASVEIVAITIGTGIGIRLTQRGWAWNVALGQGVYVRRRDGSGVVIGTDDANGLTAAIESARAAA
jgi:hypothetical protein